MMHIYVDARERGFLSYIGDLGEISVSHLAAGDYAIVAEDGAILIERKSFGDFVSSFRNGRLWEQLVKMLRTEMFQGVPVKRRLLVIEGRSERNGFSDDACSKFFSSVIGAQMESIFTYGIPIVFIEDHKEMRDLLRVAADRELQRKNEKDLPDRWYRPRCPSQLPVKDQRCYFLSAMPGIGHQLALNLMVRFPTVESLCGAGVKELEKVPGIGKKRARFIYDFLH